jgi:hypothetical protein
MEIFTYLDEHADAMEILEFGHGFNATLFERYDATRRVWGVDNWQGLHYFPSDPLEWEARFEREVRSKAPNCTFVKGLLGSDNLPELAEGSFDVICSVSVLEEVPSEAVSSAPARRGGDRHAGFALGTPRASRGVTKVSCRCRSATGCREPARRH